MADEERISITLANIWPTIVGQLAKQNMLLQQIVDRLPPPKKPRAKAKKKAKAKRKRK